MRWLLVIVAVLGIATHTDEISGTWKASIQTSNGAFENIFVLKADGSKLTGTVKTGTMPELPISEGHVEGNKVSFTVVQHSNEHDFKLRYTGILDRNELRLTLKFPVGKPVDMIAKKMSK